MPYTSSEYNPILIKNEGATIITGDKKTPGDYVFIDPNPNQEIVPHEDLFIYVDLQAEARPKSLLVEKDSQLFKISNTPGNTVSLTTPQTSVTVDGKKLFRNADNLTTSWTEIGGLKSSIKTGFDTEGFNITNIDINIKSQVAPTVVVDFVDVRGATLFEQGSCSPYGFFFQLPYPLFKLTIKGYYGKAATYHLNLIKFNAKFNSETGNMECRAEFVGYSFAFLSDILIGYVFAAGFLDQVSTKYSFDGKLKKIYENTVNFYNSPAGGNLKVSNVFCSGPNGCLKIPDLLKSLNTFDKTDKQKIIDSPEYQEVVKLKLLLNKYNSYKSVVEKLLKDPGFDSYKKEKTTSGTARNGLKIVFGTDNTAKNIVNGLVSNTSTQNLLYVNFNKTNGTLLGSIKDVLSDSLKPYDLSEKIKCLVENPATEFAVGITSPQVYNTLFSSLKTKPWFGGSGNLETLGYQSSDSSSSTYYIDFGYILDDIDRELKSLEDLVKKKTETVSAIIDKLIGERLGFSPTIRNVFTIFLANTEALMDVLKNVSVEAEKFHKTENLTLYKKEGSTEKVENSNNSYVYSWPTYSVEESSSNGEAEYEKYPGEKVEFRGWPEVIFVEDFTKAFLKVQQFEDLLNSNFENKPGYDNFAPINPLESPAWYEGTPNKYLEVVGEPDMYKTIGERMFIALDHSLFQPLRLTRDALLIGQNDKKNVGIGRGKWNPLIDISQPDSPLQQLAQLDSWNLLNSSTDKNLLRAILSSNLDENSFVTKVKDALKNGSPLKWAEGVKYTDIKRYEVADNRLPSYVTTDDWYVYLPSENGIEIKKDDTGAPVYVHPNPYKMSSDGNLIKIIETQNISSLREINITNEDFRNFLGNFTNKINSSINSLELRTTSFDPKITYAVTDSKQQMVSFESQKLYINLAMSTVGENPNETEWWSSGDVNQSTNGPLGNIVSNMSLIGYWDSDSTRQSEFGALFKRVNGVYFLPAQNFDDRKEDKDGKYPLKLSNSETVEKQLEDYQITTLKAPLVTTPIWLDNVINFRNLVTGNSPIATKNYSPDTQYKNLAYLFLHTLKTTPFVIRIIDDNGSFYYYEDGLSEPEEENGPSLIWSHRAFNSIGGIAKVPKAWLLTLGAQLWRWREFSKKNTNGSWKKFLPCDKCLALGNRPQGNDPLIQPGYNSYDNTFTRYPDYNVFFKRIQPKYYLESIYDGSFGTDYNKNLETPKSVFGGDTNNIVNGQQINDGENQIFFSYQSVYKNKLATAGTYDYMLSSVNEPNKNYAWPQVYISPHHIPFLPTDIFNDAADGEGAVFTMVTDYFAFDKRQDYQTIMPKTKVDTDYNEWNPKDYTNNGTLYQSALETGPTHRSKYEDGNLGMIFQYIPDGVKDKIVEIFETWATGDWANTLLPIVDPVNFGNKDLLSSYSYIDDDNDHNSAARNFSRESVGNIEYALTPNPNDTLKNLLTDQYWILNSTPKIWFGYQENSVGANSFFDPGFQTNDPKKSNEFYEDGFIVSATQFDTYLKAFYNSYKTNLDKRLKELDDANKDQSKSKNPTEDNDLKLALYRSFKSLNEKWLQRTPNGKDLFFNIAGSSNGVTCKNGAGPKTTLASHFVYVNRIWGDIGNLSVIDITKTNEIKDNKKMSLYQILSDILTDNEYLFFPLPTYVNLTGSQGQQPEELIKMFKPILTLEDASCGPLFVCMYVGGTSRRLDLSIGETNCARDNEDVIETLKNTRDDSYSLQDTNLPKDIQSGNFTAFKVLYGKQNQNHFKNIQLDQSEFTETAESLNVIDRLAQNQGSDRTTKGQSLMPAYLTRSYTCTIEAMGNVMIQPMTYFDLQGVPMFSGAYLITEVSHNVKPNNMSTTFKGVRQPRTIVPIVTSASATMNFSFTEESNRTGASLRSINKSTNLFNLDWKDQIKTNIQPKITSNDKDSQVMTVIRNYVEGGYYHPVHWYKNKEKFKLFKRSGETMFGEDRTAGQTENTLSGVEFWNYIDQKSGYGNYGTLPPIEAGNGTSKDNYSKKHTTAEEVKDRSGKVIYQPWDVKFLEELSTKTGTWEYNQGGLGTTFNTDSKLLELSNKMAKDQLNIFFNKWFNGQNGLIQKIESDGRLLFAWYRARYNGEGFFKEFAKNLIEVYTKNSNISNDDLLLKDLDFRWQYAQGLRGGSAELIGNDVLKIAEIVGLKPPKKNVVV